MRNLSRAVIPFLLVAIAALSVSCGKKCERDDFIKDSPIGYVATDMDGRIVFTNQAYRDMLGYNEKELAELTYHDLTPQKWHGTEKAYVDAASEMKFIRFEKEYTKKDGTIMPVQVTGWILRDKSGKPIGTASFVIDMTGQIKSEDLADMMGLAND